MKKLLLSSMLLLSLSSCTKSPMSKVEDAVREELRRTLHDFSSYEPVEWGKLDTIYVVGVDAVSGAASKPEIMEITVDHTFRAKSGAGVTRIATWKFHLTPDLSSVWKADDPLDEMLEESRRKQDSIEALYKNYE
jgi:lipoprotein